MPPARDSPKSPPQRAAEVFVNPRAPKAPGNAPISDVSGGRFLEGGTREGGPAESRARKGRDNDPPRPSSPAVLGGRRCGTSEVCPIELDGERRRPWTWRTVPLVSWMTCVISS